MRMRLSKTFTGDLVGTAEGTKLSAGSLTPGKAAATWSSINDWNTADSTGGPRLTPPGAAATGCYRELANMMAIGQNATKLQVDRRMWIGVLLALLASGCATSPETGAHQSTAPSKHNNPRPGNGFPPTGAFYPAESKSLGEVGAPNVRACVNAIGVLTAPPTLATSSGNERLDQAALALAAAGSGHYQPATDNGKPVPDCFVYKIWFGPPIRH